MCGKGEERVAAQPISAGDHRVQSVPSDENCAPAGVSFDNRVPMGPGFSPDTSEDRVPVEPDPSALCDQWVPLEPGAEIGLDLNPISQADRDWWAECSGTGRPL